jgi:hypothetical protein
MLLRQMTAEKLSFKIFPLIKFLVLLMIVVWKLSCKNVTILISAINAKEVQINFSTPVTKASVLTGSAVQNITFSPVGTATAPGALTGSL